MLTCDKAANLVSELQAEKTKPSGLAAFICNKCEAQSLPETRLPKLSMTLKLREGKMPPLAKSVMGACSLSAASMAAASLARSLPNPSVELLPSQSAQLTGISVELLDPSAVRMGQIILLVIGQK